MRSRWNCASLAERKPRQRVTYRRELLSSTSHHPLGHSSAKHSAHQPSESRGHVAPVDDADADHDEHHHEDFVEEAEQSEHGLRQDVQRRGHVQQRRQEADHHADPEHEEQAALAEALGP